MSRRSSDSRLLVLAGICSAVSLSVAAAMVLSAARSPLTPTLAAGAGSEADASLDHLRLLAASFDPDSSRQLTSELLERYEAGGSTDNLYEALQWIERDWAQPAWLRTPLVTKFVERHCDQKIVRWNWMCSGGD